MAAATNKKGLSTQRGGVIEGYIKQSKEGLVITEASVKAVLKS